MRPLTHRLVGVTAAAATAAGLALALPAAASAQVAAGTVTLNLLDINDFHGRIDSNTVAFAATIEQARAAAGEDSTVFVSAGDNIGASLYASSSALDPDGTPNPDKPTLDVLNALDLDVSAVGNHELDRGFSDLTGRVDAEADFPYVAANIYLAGTTTPAVPEYEIVERQGLRVGVIGAITSETRTLVSPAGIAAVDFGDPTDAINRVAAQLSDGDESNGEADVLVASLHEGASEGTPEGATIADEIAMGGAFAKIATQTSAEVDAIVTGHTHKEYVFDGPVPGSDRTRPIIQTGSYGANVGQAQLTVDAATGDPVSYTARNIPRIITADVRDAPAGSPTKASLIATYPRVAEVDTITRAAIAAAAVTGAVEVGEISDDITRAFSNGAYVDGSFVVPQGAPAEDRSEESAAGHLVANAVRDADIPSGEVPDIGVTNPGGLRADLRFGADPVTPDTNGDGVITVAEAVAVQPFANSLFLVTLTGAQLKTLLEQQDQPAAASRPYLALGLSDNVTYTYDRTRPVGDRITSITVDGATVAAGDSFRIATNSFLAAGGDNFGVLAEGANPTDTGLIDLDVFTNAIATGSPVSPVFAKSGASVEGLTDEEKTPAAGDTIDFAVSDLGLSSLGAPEVTEVEVLLGETSLGAFPVTPSEGTPGVGNQQTGTAQVSVTIPASATGAQALTVRAAGGTTVTIPLQVAGAPGGPGATGADLALAIAAPTFDGGGQQTYTVTVTNNGPADAPASRVELAAFGPATVAAVSEGTVTGNRVSVAVPAIATGDSVEVTVTLQKTVPIGFAVLAGVQTRVLGDPVLLNNLAVRGSFIV